MKDDVALKRYLERHIEPDLPSPPPVTTPWDNTLVIPAYRESPDLLARLASAVRTAASTLVILVLNRPDSDADTKANADLREAVLALPPGPDRRHKLSGQCDLYCHDMELQSGLTPAKQGVGLARKTGCDIATLWRAHGAISGEWICCTDGDALLPGDYFDRLKCIPSTASAAVFPFMHTPAGDSLADTATALYELRLHHYVLGLEYAASPYAYHSLGSCLAIQYSTYTRVRGFPRRSGGEDFYLLNKARKIGPVTRLGGAVIRIESRLSRRVPFGTGPAVEEIVNAGALKQQRKFYHPACFEILRVAILTIPEMRYEPTSKLESLLAERGLDTTAARHCAEILSGMGMDQALEHCRSHGKTGEQFLHQFHQWFDAFRTLKFIHGLRDRLWPDQSLAELPTLEPGLWPVIDQDDISLEALRNACRNHWGWTSSINPDRVDW